MMIHVQSFLVGSIATASVGLAIHQQLSHRRRLTRKWPVYEWLEDKVRTQWKAMVTEMRAERTDLVAKNPLNLQPKFSLKMEWNNALDQAQKSLAKKED